MAAHGRSPSLTTTQSILPATALAGRATTFPRDRHADPMASAAIPRAVSINTIRAVTAFATMLTTDR